ncbi:Alpha/Beta hydrolase protein [Mycena vitilis]|nr:Alpha/Beta hydrolase protein [Mycena vitilis]
MAPLLCLLLATSSLFLPCGGLNADGFNVQPFRIDLGHKVAHMKLLVENTRLPDTSLYPTAGIDFGIELDFLRDLRSRWLDHFNWTKQESELNELPQFTANIEGQKVHFVHATSAETDRIPLLMLHGWPGKHSRFPVDFERFIQVFYPPGSFQEFLPIIKPLTQLWKSPTGKRVSFDVIAPSLPGFLFSSSPPRNWNNTDTARIFDTLMTDVLGYSTYALHGTDRLTRSKGSQIGYVLYSSYNTSVRAAHLNSIPFLAPTPEEIVANNIIVSDIGKVTEQRTVDYRATGTGYFTEQTFKVRALSSSSVIINAIRQPNSIGLALYDNPVGQLAWIGGNIQLWSDPRAGTSPSILTHEILLTMVSLYCLTHTFQSSVWIYAQNPTTFSSKYVKPATDAPLVFSLYEFDLMFWPKEYVARVSNLVLYKEHDFGGHFSALDNPPALIEDLHDLGLFFEPSS